jgi:hypothetical protein
MTSPSRRALTAGLLIALVCALSAMSAAASSPLKITNCFKASERPRLLTLTCGDANAALSDLRWSSFGGTSAKATGTFEMNNCTPNCAAGKFLKYPVSVQASGPRTCKAGLRVYNKLTLHFTRHAPADSVRLKQWTLGCPIP